MVVVPQDYVERVYAGWLGKAIGVRHGGNIEGWTYEMIERTFGEITGYLHDFINFAADDDTNGPVFFVRALEDYTHTVDITAEQMGQGLLNYAPDHHGFFWWGGYGKSTEHTAYLNLKMGIPAPRSGSIAQNGQMIAEQIGGQIFIDVWGLIAPGNPRLAASYAEKMASVTHDGNGIFGGMFIAACVAAAFNERDIGQVLNAGLSVIPADCEYARMVRAITEFHRFRPDDWRACFQEVKASFGYHLYPGNCHIIPNAAVVILALLYGGGSFSAAVNICNMCGWDTDCNVANVGAIMGVKEGLAGIDMSWREPIGDFLCCSSVIGSLNIGDIPRIAAYTARFGYRIAGIEPPAHWASVVAGDAARLHFQLPGSTHAMRTDTDMTGHITVKLANEALAGASGGRALKVVFDKASEGYGFRTYCKTYYRPEDFNDSRYDPAFSPLLYPGQTLTARVMLPSAAGVAGHAIMYVRDRHSGARHYGPASPLEPGVWERLTWSVPPMSNVCLEEAGVEFIPMGVQDVPLILYVDELDWQGKPNYDIDFRKERMEVWHTLHQEVSQCTILRGIWELETGELAGSYAGESAECYTGDIEWTDYEFSADVTPKLGSGHYVLCRVQGAIRSYAAGLGPDGTVALLKNDNGYRTLASAPFDWRADETYALSVTVAGNRLSLRVNSEHMLEYADDDRPYVRGQVGFANIGGGRTHYKRYAVRGSE